MSVPAAMAATVLLAGCSADIARFDFPPTFNLTEGKSAKSLTPSQGMASADPAFDSGGPAPARSGNSIYTPPPGEPDSGIRMTALDDPSARPADVPRYAPPPRVEPRRITTAAPGEAGGRGETITVVSGDTLYGLSRKHHVSISELMSVNGLTSPRIMPGQTLHLPGSGGMAQTRTATVAPARPAPQRTPALAAAPRASDAPGTHTIQPGDSLYKIARQYGTTVERLKTANAVSDPRALRPGKVLRIPGADSPASPLVAETYAPPASPAPSRMASSEPAQSSRRPVDPPARIAAAEAPSSDGSGGTGLTGLTVVNGPATAKPVTATDASPSATVAPLSTIGAKPVKVAEIRPAAAPPAPPLTESPAMAGKLRWPAKGRVVAGFGKRPGGGHNDGVDLAVPLGTDVHAAESGVVAYAGSELKGYGNLVLIRHENGWVTAYAHNDQLLVKRGDKVRRGQVVAKAGKTGTVDQPQVHFELRMGSKPVDPMPYMEKI